MAGNDGGNRMKPCSSRTPSRNADGTETTLTVTAESQAAVGLRAAARRIGISYGYARRLTMEGRFPVPHLPRFGKRGHFRFSPYELEDYLRSASTPEAQVRRCR